MGERERLFNMKPNAPFVALKHGVYINHKQISHIIDDPDDNDGKIVHMVNGHLIHATKEEAEDLLLNVGIIEDIFGE